jgi:hypothetical protein
MNRLPRHRTRKTIRKPHWCGRDVGQQKQAPKLKAHLTPLEIRMESALKPYEGGCFGQQ